MPKISLWWYCKGTLSILIINTNTFFQKLPWWLWNAITLIAYLLVHGKHGIWYQTTHSANILKCQRLSLDRRLIWRSTTMIEKGPSCQTPVKCSNGVTKLTHTVVSTGKVPMNSWYTAHNNFWGQYHNREKGQWVNLTHHCIVDETRIVNRLTINKP